MDNTRLKNIRKNLRYTQKEMADLLGVGLRNYQYYESGETKIPDEKIIKLIEMENTYIAQSNATNEKIPIYNQNKAIAKNAVCEEFAVTHFNSLLKVDAFRYKVTILIYKALNKQLRDVYANTEPDVTYEYVDDLIYNTSKES